MGIVIEILYPIGKLFKNINAIFTSPISKSIKFHFNVCIFDITYLYLYLRRSRDATVFVLVFGCLLPSLHSVRFGQLLRCAHKRIVNIMKVYIERNNIQVELIRFRKTCRLYSRLRLLVEGVREPLYVYSLFARLQQFATNKLITIHSPDVSTPRYAHRNECIMTV